MSDFNFAPSFTSKLLKEPNINSAKFGDNYEVRIADGINNNPQMWDLIFSAETKDNADSIESFLDDRAGVTKFTWTPPGKPEINVICKKWIRNYINNGIDSFSMTFIQVFEV